MVFPTTRRGAWLLLLAVAVPTTWLGHAQATTPIDSANVALKSIDGRDADAMARRTSSFGDDRVLLAGLQPRLPGAGFGADDAASLDALAHAVTRIDGVGRIETAPASAAGGRLWIIHLTAQSHAGLDERVVGAVEAALRSGCPPQLTCEFTGLPAVEVAIAGAVADEQRRILPAIAGALFTLLLLLFRRVGVAVAALAPAVVSIAWTGGLFALTGHRLDPLAALLQPVLLTVGVAYAVHHIDGCLARATRMSPAAAVQRTARDLLEPGLLACGTTVLGFLVNVLSPIPAVVAFAIHAAFGVAATVAAVFWLVPAVLVAWPGALRGRRQPWSGFARALTGFAGRHAPTVVSVGLLVALWGGVACTGLTVDNDPLRILPASHPLRLDTERLAARLGGVEPFDVLVPADSAWAEPTSLRMLAADLATRVGVSGLAGPPIAAASGDILLRAILPRAGSGPRGRVFDAIEGSLRRAGHAEVLVTGSAVQVVRDSNRLVTGQLLGLGATLVVLFAAMAVGLRSLRAGLIGLAPSVVTCLIVYATLASMNRPVSVATALIGSVMLGLIVDTTIHILVRFRRARAHGAGRHAAVASALQRAGRPVFVTSLVLGTGFSVAGFGSLSTTSEFGLLAALTIAVAALVSLLLVPALLLVGRSGGER